VADAGPGRAAVGPSGTAGRHIVLVGLPGSGKSTVGALVAERLGREFLDFDRVIERRHGDTIASIFAQFGEARFRALERELTAEVVERAKPSVLAPGGGWITIPEGVALLRPHGVLVYLRASPKTVLARLGAATATRPLLAGEESPLAALERLLAERGPLYAGADHEIDTDRLDPIRVAERVVQLATAAAGDR
jgi:shikimate kinase